MKIIRYKAAESTIAQVGMTDGQSVWNISQLCGDAIGSTQKVIDAIVKKQVILEKLNQIAPDCSLNGVHLLAPIIDPGKLFCIGRNYADHASEMGSTVDQYPVVFNKFPSVIIGPGDQVQLPAISDRVDFEAELVVVIGNGGSNIQLENAMEHVFGFTCGNDISARDWQKNGPGGQWLLGKSFDTFAPLGPWIVLSDEIPDPVALDIELILNGKQMQSSNTKHLIFNIPYLVSHVSKFCCLYPGDLVFTGTPSGVGAARQPPVFLKSGDQLRVQIARIGSLNNVVAARESTN